jgi:hypothetical protein
MVNQQCLFARSPLYMRAHLYSVKLVDQGVCLHVQKMSKEVTYLSAAFKAHELCQIPAQYIDSIYA